MVEWHSEVKELAESADEKNEGSRNPEAEKP